MRNTIAPLTFVMMTLLVLPVSGTTIKAPDFSFHDTDDQIQSLSMYEGKVLVIDIMFSTCSVCNKMMPDLVDVYEVVKEEMGDDVHFLSVSVDVSDDNKVLDDFMEQYGAQWPIGMDSSFINVYDAMEVPKLVVISPEGYITYNHKGYIDKEEVQEEIISAIDFHYSPITEIPFLEMSTLVVGSMMISILIKKRTR